MMPSLLVVVLYGAALHAVVSAIEEAQPALESKHILFVMLSQPSTYHAGRAQLFKKELLQQDGSITLYLLHEKWPQVGAWTVLPMLPDLVPEFYDGQNSSQTDCCCDSQSILQADRWIMYPGLDIYKEHPTKAGVFFFEEETHLNLKMLMAGLQEYDLSKELFLGRGLRDKEATVIHHFAFHENPSSFVYPDFAAGFLLSMPLVKKLADERASNPPRMDFSIDVKHEGESIDKDNLLIVVKTCKQFHTERVPVVQKTWAKDAKHLEFASEVADDSIPTVAVVAENTEKGHCAKFMAILERVHKANRISSKDWLAVVDDDTLLSVPRLQRLLACHDPGEPVVLGERYGYGTAAGLGYDYITGGGGTILSFVAVRQVVESQTCYCGAADSPDDMTLGMCLNRLGIPVTHSPLFHQARPSDYSEDYLSHQVPVSFHKHWMVDPYKVYKDWLVDERSHDEL